MVGVISFLVFAAALAVRAFINRGHTWGTPDEKTYSTYAVDWRIGKKYQASVEAFLSKSALDIPPTRYGFFAVCSGLVTLLKTPAFQTVTWVAAVSGAAAAPLAYWVTHSLPASLLVASTPLSLILSRRALQDTFAALALLIGVLAIQLQSVGLLTASVALALASREALVLYLPAIFAAWTIRTGRWCIGSAATSGGILAAIVMYYALGGRRLAEIFRKLRQSTDYVRRFQSGDPHRILTDLILVSPVTTIGAIVACTSAPLWLVGFVGISLATHAFIVPKNVRFLLVVDLGARMLCGWLPGPWPWVILGVGLIADLRLYRAFKEVRDTVTYNLVVKAGMYLEK